MTIAPFTIRIPQETLDDLGRRLIQTRWIDEVDGAGWDYGTSTVYLKELVQYWHEQFDWRTQEARLNRFANFRTEINGLGVHFIHERGKGANPLPIILTHGYPDSFWRFEKLIPLLVEERDGISFDVVVPSELRPPTRHRFPLATSGCWVDKQ